MLPFSVETAVICDDIRQERNGKYLLIGVYGGNIVVQGFPSDILLSVWLLLKPSSSTRAEMRLRVVGPQETVLVEGGFSFDLKDQKSAILALPGMPLQFQREGRLRFEVSPDGKDTWTPIKEMTVELAPTRSPPA